MLSKWSYEKYAGLHSTFIWKSKNSSNAKKQTNGSDKNDLICN